MKKLLLASLLFFASAVNAGWQDWTEEQRQWYVAANIVTLADWATTRDMTRRYNEGYHELNPLLGRHPTTDRVDRHFALGFVLNYLFIDWLESENRTLYLKVYTIGEGAIAARNLSIGLRLRF